MRRFRLLYPTSGSWCFPERSPLKRWIMLLAGLASMAGVSWVFAAEVSASRSELTRLRVLESAGRLKLVVETSLPVKPVLDKAPSKLIVRVPGSHLASTATLDVN